MATFNYPPSYSAQQTKKPRVLKAQFGDGYQQRVGDGINNSPREWSLQFSGRTIEEADAIDDFLNDQGGILAFDWAPPLGSAGKWVCEEWSRSLDKGNSNQISATFKEVFEP